jgi:uncharacterized membrane protein
MDALTLLRFAHLSADVVWIGSIVAAGWTAAGPHGSDEVRGQLARRVYSTFAVPSFLVALLSGLALLFSNTGYYLSATAFMHPKLTLAVGVIALHHIIGARTKRMAMGKVSGAGPLKVLTLVLLGCAAGAAFFVVVKPF